MYSFRMRIRLTKWGNSLGIRLPKIFVVHMGLQMGKELDLELRKDSLVVSPVDTLDALLERVSSENVHGETDTGKPFGKEIW